MGTNIKGKQARAARIKQKIAKKASKNKATNPSPTNKIRRTKGDDRMGKIKSTAKKAGGAVINKLLGSGGERKRRSKKGPSYYAKELLKERLKKKLFKVKYSTR